MYVCIFVFKLVLLRKKGTSIRKIRIWALFSTNQNIDAVEKSATTLQNYQWIFKIQNLVRLRKVCKRKLQKINFNDSYLLHSGPLIKWTKLEKTVSEWGFWQNCTKTAKSISTKIQIVLSVREKFWDGKWIKLANLVYIFPARYI